MAAGARMSVTLPWPPKELSPNARIHRMAKARAAKIYREQAYGLTKAAGLCLPDSEHVSLRFEFHAPDHRPRDLDNMLASIKAGIDGIADAMEVNDARFGIWLSRREPMKGGRVVVSVVE